MTFKTSSTADLRDFGNHKTLLYTLHGFGKTYQAKHYMQAYGKGLIISGESGLATLGDVDIPYLNFSSWDGEHDPEKDVFSFRGIVKMIRSDEFTEGGFNWIMLDSLTELSDRLMASLEVKHAGSNNGFEIWADYGRLMIGALKWIRDLKLHVIVTSLAKDESDDNGKKHYWPMIKGSTVSRQVPGLFDHVFGGYRIVEKDTDGNQTVRRFLVSEETAGWHGKTRDPRSVLQPVEESGNVIELLERIRTGEVPAKKEPTTTPEKE